MKLTTILKESSLSRILSHMQDHDCGIITAFRNARDCGAGERYTRAENLQRNRSLFSKIFTAYRHQITAIKGVSVENYGSPNAKEISEEVFFVVDAHDRGTLLADLKRWGEEFEQDSILFIPKGGNRAELHGTYHCPNGFPKFGEVNKIDSRKLGAKGEFFTIVNGRPFKFYSLNDISENVGPGGNLGYWACSMASKKHWTEMLPKNIGRK